MLVPYTDVQVCPALWVDVTSNPVVDGEFVEDMVDDEISASWATSATTSYLNLKRKMLSSNVDWLNTCIMNLNYFWVVCYSLLLYMWLCFQLQSPNNSYSSAHHLIRLIKSLYARRLNWMSELGNMYQCTSLIFTITINSQLKLNVQV